MEQKTGVRLRHATVTVRVCPICQRWRKANTAKNKGSEKVELVATLVVITGADLMLDDAFLSFPCEHDTQEKAHRTKSNYDN